MAGSSFLMDCIRPDVNLAKKFVSAHAQRPSDSGGETFGGPTFPPDSERTAPSPAFVQELKFTSPLLFYITVRFGGQRLWEKQDNEQLRSFDKAMRACFIFDMTQAKFRLMNKKRIIKDEFLAYGFADLLPIIQ